MSKGVINKLRQKIDEVLKDRRAAVELHLDSRVYISAVIGDTEPYSTYKVPNTEEDVSLYWLDDRYDSLEDTLILHHYSSDVKFVYDNGIRSIDFEGNPTSEEDIEDILYIQIASASDISESYVTEKSMTTIAPHVEAITLYVYNDYHEVILERVLGYKVTDVYTVVGELSSDWKSTQLIGNLLDLEDTI